MNSDSSHSLHFPMVHPNPFDENPTMPPERIFIWNLDQTVFLHQSSENGNFSHRSDKDAQWALSLAFQMDQMILDLVHQRFFYQDLKDFDQIHIDDLSSHDDRADLTLYDFAQDAFPSSSSTLHNGIDRMRKFAYRYRLIKQFYQDNRSNFQNLDHLTDFWIHYASKCLDQIEQRRNSRNVFITSNSLILAIGKICVNNLAPSIDIENLYSYAKIDLHHCFERIRNRFGRSNTYIVVGHNTNDEILSKKFSWSFWPLHEYQHLIALSQALDWHLL